VQTKNLANLFSQSSAQPLPNCLQTPFDSSQIGRSSKEVGRIIWA
jgi:hypothetical protein